MGIVMFYEETSDMAFRFGDVLQGFILAASTIKEPTPTIKKYEVSIDLPIYSVILSPCCSIGDKVISLTPLIEVKGSFFDNPYFAEDVTRINRKMKPEQTIAPHVWDNFPPEQKQKRLNEGETYAFLSMFIYEKHDLLPIYPIKLGQRIINTNYYMIDFRNTCKVNCDKIISAERAPLELKCFQLSVRTRTELREKITYYYSRPPKEDKD
jgi:hypothetical protein